MNEEKTKECGYCKKVQQSHSGNLGYQCKRHTKHMTVTKIRLYNEEQLKDQVNKQIDLIDTTVNSLYSKENIDNYTLDKILSIIQKFKL